ncbi:hypothetical protein GW17_00039154 [Ensete ventricosum]|nr:hypothetical protein GW17_00039154 [Ensete ventricosum]
MSSPFRQRMGGISSAGTRCCGIGGGSLGVDPPNPKPSPNLDFLRQDPILSAILLPPPPQSSFRSGLGWNTRDLRTDPKRPCIFASPAALLRQHLDAARADGSQGQAMRRESKNTQLCSATAVGKGREQLGAALFVGRIFGVNLFQMRCDFYVPKCPS